MHTEKREDPLVELGYEVRDVNFPILGKVALWFGVFSVSCFGVVLAWYLLAKPQSNALLDARKPIPDMTIQGNSSVRIDIQELRQKETQALSSYGKNDDGSLTMPIDKAIDVVAQRGLPNTPTSTPAVTLGNTIKQNAVQPGTVAASPPAGAPTP